MTTFNITLGCLIGAILGIMLAVHLLNVEQNKGYIFKKTKKK